MKIIKQSWRFMENEHPDNLLSRIEEAGRLCYRSENEYGDINKRNKFIATAIKNGHESILEHGAISVKIITDRATSHQLVRHRLASYSQESQRYCNYSKDKFSNEIAFILPVWLDGSINISYNNWESAMDIAEAYYFGLLDQGCTPEQARTVLPNSTKTELVISCNVREWRHIFKERTSKRADAQIRGLMTDMLNGFKHKYGVLFEDIIA